MPTQESKDTRPKFPHKSFTVTTICIFIIISLFYLLFIGIKPGAVDILSVAEIEQTDLSEECVLLNEQIADWYPGELYTSQDFYSMPPMLTDDDAKYGTYRIELNIPAGETYGITGLSSDYAQNIYVNGELLSQIGNVSADVATFVPKTDYYTVFFTTQTNTTEIIIQLAYHNHEYGNLKNTYLAQQDVIIQRNRAEFLSNGLIIGVLLSFVVFFLGMFLSYTERISFLWFALTCFFAALHYSIYFNKDIMAIIPNVSWYILHKAEYLARIGFYFFLILHVVTTLKLKLQFPFKCLIWGSLGIISLFYIFTPSIIYTKFVFIIGAILTIALISITAHILYLGHRNKLFANKENLFMGLSPVLMTVAWLCEAFTYQGNTWYIQPYITILIVFFNAIALTMQFSRTERELAHLQIKQQEITQNAAMLEGINNMKTDFFHKMAHEIKTPLAIMSGYAQLTNAQIKNDEINSETMQNLKVISSEATRLAQLVSNLMEMPTTPISKAVLSKISVAEYLHYACAVCKGLLEKKGNKLIIKGNTQKYILGNMEMLVQMMINLAANSNKHMENGEFKIKVMQEKNSDSITLLVSDTGCGIPTENAQKIFEKGFTTNGTKGLGLSICKEVAQLHKGDIVLLTDNNQGATYKITIPTYKDEE